MSDNEMLRGPVARYFSILDAFCNQKMLSVQAVDELEREIERMTPMEKETTEQILEVWNKEEHDV